MNARQLAVAFLRLTMTTRLDIARQLGLDDGLDEFTPHEVSNEICRRVNRRGLRDDFERLVASREQTQ